MTAPDETLAVADLARCFEGAIPAVVGTVGADGMPNATYISRVHQVDDERVALSNQFMSKTSRNLAFNPVATLMIIDPTTYEEYRLEIRYERTERRGRIFERLSKDVDELAELSGLQDVFRLRAADIFRVVAIERVNGSWPPVPDPTAPSRSVDALARFGELVDRAGDLDTLVDVAVEGFARQLGYEHVALLLLDERGERLFTIAGRGFPESNLGSEVALGVGPVGIAVERCEVQRIAGLRQVAKYSRTVRESFERTGISPGRDVPVPSLPDVDTRIVAPMISLGQLVGAIIVEHTDTPAFDTIDERVIAAAATMLAGAIEHARSAHMAAATVAVSDEADQVRAPTPPPGSCVHVRFFAHDGSVFLDDDYLIKGVAGRILRALVVEHRARGRVDFTNRELRLDQSLDLPGFKDNLESRLVLLKRRLDERAAPLRIERTGRGRFRLLVERLPVLEVIDDAV